MLNHRGFAKDPREQQRQQSGTREMKDVSSAHQTQQFQQAGTPDDMKRQSVIVEFFCGRVRHYDNLELGRAINSIAYGESPRQRFDNGLHSADTRGKGAGVNHDVQHVLAAVSTRATLPDQCSSCLGSPAMNPRQFG